MLKALIFNSGVGSRLGFLTERNPKCMVELPGGETIFHRQLRILSSVGVRDFVVTTGPWPEQLEEVAAEFEGLGCSFSFVHNDRFRETNYIYSMWLARDMLRGSEVLVLHGDLVFDAGFVASLLDAPKGSYGSTDPTLPVPEKDFSADIRDGEVRKVGVGISGECLQAFQAMYRLTPAAMDKWLDEIELFVNRGDTVVYAENAANEVFEEMHVRAFAYTEHVLEEIDTPDDLARVGAMVRARDFADQPAFVLTKDGSHVLSGCPVGKVVRAPRLGSAAQDCGLTHPLVIADPFLSHGDLERILGPGEWPVFTGYTPNPTYGQALAAVDAFRVQGCDSVISVGGGSAIDVAKCVSLWANAHGDGSGVEGNPRYCDVRHPRGCVKHMSVPTTAGTGSESTHFAVVYVDGEKRSVAEDFLQPDVALLVPALLSGLPSYQRKSTLLDAFCQAVESYWSVASNDVARAYSSLAIPMIMRSWQSYLEGDESAACDVMKAANLAGRAINLTTTTLAHAMSYKLTSLCGLAHGHAVALCMPFAWRTLIERGDEVTLNRLREVDTLVTGRDDASMGSGLDTFLEMFNSMGLESTIVASDDDLDLLARSVNPERMGNYPVRVELSELREAYSMISDRA